MNPTEIDPDELRKLRRDLEAHLHEIQKTLLLHVLLVIFFAWCATGVSSFGRFIFLAAVGYFLWHTSSMIWMWLEAWWTLRQANKVNK